LVHKSFSLLSNETLERAIFSATHLGLRLLLHDSLYLPNERNKRSSRILRRYHLPLSVIQSQALPALPHAKQ
jgi:hypothetical protein